MELTEPQTLVHLGSQATVRSTLAGQASEGRVVCFLASVADRTAPTLERLGQTYLLEVASGKLAGPGHGRPRNAIGVITTTA